MIARAVPPRQRRILGGCASFGRHRSVNVALKVGGTGKMLSDVCFSVPLREETAGSARHL